MRKLNSINSVPVAVDTSYTPLSGTLYIRSASDQLLEQWYDERLQTYRPDRASTEPLTLVPVLTLFDPDLNTAITSPSFTVVWREIKEHNGTVTDSGDVTNITDTVTIAGQTYRVYTVNSNGTLIVRRNVPVDWSYRLRCEVTYTDTRTGGTMKFQKEVTLLTSKTEDPAYIFELTTKRRITYRPLMNSVSSGAVVVNNVKFGAQLHLGEAVLSSAKYFWYWVDNSHPNGVLFGDANNPCAAYVSGQGTDELTLNPDRTDGLTVMLMAGSDQTKQTPDVPLREYFALQVVYDEVKGHVTSPNGSRLRAAMKSMVFQELLKVNDADMPDAIRNEYIRLNWKRKKASLSTVNDERWGYTVDIPRANIVTTGGDSMLVYTEIHVLGSLDYLTDDSPGGSGLVTDNSPGGSGYVLGRV
jgi:hypothetical protein